jgi:hypothetical protein
MAIKLSMEEANSQNPQSTGFVSHSNAASASASALGLRSQPAEPPGTADPDTAPATSSQPPQPPQPASTPRDSALDEEDALPLTPLTQPVDTPEVCTRAIQQQGEPVRPRLFRGWSA